jgi:hypothetical protein
MVIVVTFMLAIAFYSFASSPLALASAQTGTSQQQQQQQPNINATNLYDTGQMILPGNVKHLVILLPNEAHESPELEEEQRHIAQPYIPQKAIVSLDTMVVWFNGDVDHDHKITLQDTNTNQIVFDSPVFTFNEASNPIVLNNTGSYRYYEADVLEDDPDFVMEGTIDVINQRQQSSPLPTSSVNSSNPSTQGPGDIDTLGTLMVPAQDLDEHISYLNERGFGVNSVHTFADLRGGQEGTGSKQTLIVWTADSQMGLDKILSDLEELTPSLPYS